MATILVPSREQPRARETSGNLPKNTLGALGGLAGGVAGGVVGMATGGPWGAAAGATGGAAGGASLGGAIQGVVDPVKMKQSFVPDVAAIESTGMDRRSQQLTSDPLAAINEARHALANLPNDVLPETRKSFDNALELAKRNQILS